MKSITDGVKEEALVAAFDYAYKLPIYSEEQMWLAQGAGVYPPPPAAARGTPPLNGAPPSQPGFSGRSNPAAAAPSAARQYAGYDPHAARPASDARNGSVRDRLSSPPGPSNGMEHGGASENDQQDEGGTFDELNYHDDREVHGPGGNADDDAVGGIGAEVEDEAWDAHEHVAGGSDASDIVPAGGAVDDDGVSGDDGGTYNPTEAADGNDGEEEEQG